jgi:hypothetical protein
VDSTKPVAIEIEKAEQREALKQALLRLLDDPQVQQKIVTLLRRQLGLHRVRLDGTLALHNLPASP